MADGATKTAKSAAAECLKPRQQKKSLSAEFHGEAFIVFVKSRSPWYTLGDSKKSKISNLV